jgi:hypothetical protein
MVITYTRWIEYCLPIISSDCPMQEVYGLLGALKGWCYCGELGGAAPSVTIIVRQLPHKLTYFECSRFIEISRERG